MRTHPVLVGLALLLLTALAGVGVAMWPRTSWTAEQLATLRSLWIGSLPPVPADPSNAVADDLRAARLGQELFFDTRLSSNGQVACATCHQPGRAFADGLPLAQGVGTTDRKTPSIVGTAYSPWQFWDGRADSQWAQALGPLESAVEHGGARTQYAHLIAEQYREEYEALFGPIPDLSDPSRFPAVAGPVPDPAARAAWEAMAPEDRKVVTQIYVNLGKAIAAYERRIVPGPARFDAFAEALLTGDTATAERTLSADEVAGLRLFIGRGECTKCHQGPLFTNHDFHNIGAPSAPGMPADLGRAKGATEVLANEFNCSSPYSDDRESCNELRFLKTGDHTQEGAFKTPSLRNVAERAPYLHAGQLSTLSEVLDHYNQAPEATVGHSELTPLGLSPTERRQIEAFLRTLSGPVAAAPELLAPPNSS